jgi:serine/threonine-protein kinase RsbW
MEKKTKHFTLINRIDELKKLDRLSAGFVRKWKLTGDLTTNLNLVLEEAISNIISYAYNDSHEHTISVEISLEGDLLTILIIDDGIPFNPASHLPPDTSLPATERPVGGLGILLISKIMDSVQYSRENNLNILTLSKNI